LGCCPLHWTEPWPGGLSGSLIGAGDDPDGDCGNSEAASGFMPLLTVGAGMTPRPGLTPWSQRAPGAGQDRIWFGSPYQGLVPSGTYGWSLRHSIGVAARLPGTSTHG
jgi:hypothetical protein